MNSSLHQAGNLQAFDIMEDDDDCSGSIDLDEFSFFQPGRATPSYATVLKRGAKGAQGYAAAAAALSGIPATYKLPTKMKCVPTKKQATTDPNKLYLDSAATYHSVFVTWCLKNIRDAGRIIRGNCNAGVKLSTKVGDLGVFKMWINEGGIANLLSIPQTL